MSVITRLNSGVSRNATRWKETTIHTIPSRGSADDIQKIQVIEMFRVTT